MKNRTGDGTVPIQQRVLVVEDDPETAEYLERLLIEAGYSVVLASDANTATVLLAGQHPDLILMDILLPDGDGYDLTSQLRASTSDLPIIMLTALAQSAQRERGFDVGADDYVVKPFAQRELLARIALQLRRRNEQQSLASRTHALMQDLEYAQRSGEASSTGFALEHNMRVELLRSINTHLQSLCTVFDIEYRREAPGAGRKALDRVIPRLRNAALIYQISAALVDETTDIAPMIQSICTSLKTVYSPRKRLPITIDVPSLTIPSAIASPLAMITTELVTNAFRHAFPGGRFGNIEVRGTIDGERFMMQIIDDGIGLPAPHTFQRGLSTVRELVQDLGGEFRFVAESQGTHAEIQLPGFIAKS